MGGRRGLVSTYAVSKSVMVVESPAKAKKIQEYLGSDVKVLRVNACGLGHGTQQNPNL